MTKILAYPGCPPLSWIIAKRVTNKYEDADAFISFTGRKGSSKSTSSMAFCEDIAYYIAYMRGKGEPPEKFFSVDHIRTITPTGAAELLSSKALQNENSIFLLDDVGTQWAARKFNDPLNIMLGQILQVCRVYRCVIVANFIMANHIDLHGRQMTDYRAKMLWKNVKEQQAFFSLYYIEQGEKAGKPHEYKKFLRWHGKRITQWVIGKPSEKLEKAYKLTRRENTDKFCEDAAAMIQQFLAKQGSSSQDGRVVSDYAVHPEVLKIQDKVRAIRADPNKTNRQKTNTAIAREINSTRYWVERVK